MIEVIKRPEREFVDTCDRCHCTVRYLESDTKAYVGYDPNIKVHYINCPCCHNVIFAYDEERMEKL